MFMNSDDEEDNDDAEEDTRRCRVQQTEADDFVFDQIALLQHCKEVAICAICTKLLKFAESSSSSEQQAQTQTMI